MKFLVRADLDQLVERPLVLWARNPAAIELTLDKAEIVWPDRSPDWFEDRAWIWLHYGATKLQRGELFEAMGMIAFFREQVLGPMLNRRQRRPQRGVRNIEQIGREIDKLRGVVADHSKGAVTFALQNAVHLYLELRDDELPSVLTPGMPELLMPFLQPD